MSAAVAGPVAAALATGPPGARALRVTWVQPEDLVGHELRQRAEEGQEVTGLAARWRAAGGHPAPGRAGASPGPAPAALRASAEDLLDALDALGPPDGAEALREPTSLDAIVAACPDWPGPGTPYTRDRATLRARLESAWLGRAAGCLLGKPVEKLPLDGIRALAKGAGNWPLRTWFTEVGVDPAVLAAHPWNRRSAATSLAENIDGMPEDDDLEHPLLVLELLRRHGRAFGTADLGRLWLEEVPAGRLFTAERIAYGNLLRGIEPPHTARVRNPFREWIGAQIRADVHGWTHPGDPAGAAAQVWRDATLTHTGNGVYGAMFFAAVLAEATGGGGDVHHCLGTGLRVVPPRSRLARAVREAIALAREHAGADFETVVDRLHAEHGHYHWVHVVPNAALVAAALTHAGGDWAGSVTRAVSGGWDTDSNGATAGSVAGVLHTVPDRWTAPLHNCLRTSVRGAWDTAGGGAARFDTLSALTTELALAPGDFATAPVTAAVAAAGPPAVSPAPRSLTP